MLVFLPFFVWLLTVLLWLGGSYHARGENKTHHSIRTALIFASICCGTGLTIITELLSLFNALTKVWVSFVWVTALILLTIIGIKNGCIRRGLKYLYTRWMNLPKGDLLLGGLYTLLSSALLLIIVISPIGNDDSLLYHLSRVVHWAQNASLRHYATAVVQQLYNPIWAEEAVLHLRILLGNDRLAGIVQWVAMLGSIVVVTKIASELQVGRIGQWIAGAFAFSLPMGILQSVSAQNDYVAAFWLLVVAWLCILASKHQPSYQESLMFGLAIGLGLLTKGTFYPFIVPFVLWYGIVAIHRSIRQADKVKAIKRTLIKFSIIILCIFILNLGYWLRNIWTFNGPLGPSYWVSNMTAGQYTLGAFLASIIRNIAMNFSSPFEEFNTWLVQTLRTKLIPLDPRMANFNLAWNWNSEDVAGNPLHVVLIMVAVIELLLARKSVKDKRLWIYFCATCGAFFMLALVVHPDNYGVRYQLPIFLLSAVLIGAASNIVSEKTNPNIAAPRSMKLMMNRFWHFCLWGFTLMLLIAAIPWILFNYSRPILALKNGGEPFSIPCLPYLGCTIGSILFEPPTTSLFVNFFPLRQPLKQLSQDLSKSTCKQVGLRIDSHDPEYLFWWMLNAPQSGVHIETIYTFPELERYIDPAYHPCAIICTICSDRTQLNGLNLLGTYSGIKLFTGIRYTSDPGPKN